MILMRMLLLLLTFSAMLLSPSIQDDHGMFGDFLDGLLEKKGDASAVDHHLENKTENRRMKNEEMQEEEKKKKKAELYGYEERTTMDKPARFQKMVRKCGKSKQMRGDQMKSCSSWVREEGDDSGLTDFSEADYNEPMHHPPSNN